MFKMKHHVPTRVKIARWLNGDDMMKLGLRNMFIFIYFICVVDMDTVSYIDTKFVGKVKVSRHVQTNRQAGKQTNRYN